MRGRSKRRKIERFRDGEGEGIERVRETDGKEAEIEVELFSFYNSVMYLLHLYLLF